MQVPVEMKIKYLKRRMEDIQRLRISLEHEDYSFAQKVGHQVKGNAATFDVPQIAQLGFELEKAAIRKDKDTVMFLIQEMESVIATSEIFV